MTDLLAKNLAFLLKGDKNAQTAVAEAIGVTQPTISKWSQMHEKAVSSEPSFRNMAKLAARFKITLDDLGSRDLEVEGPSSPAGVASLSQRAGLDVAKLADLLSTLDSACEKARVRIPPRVRARLVASIYADEEASAASSPQAIQAALVGILSTMEISNEPDAAR